jgi:hypothetical protein
MPSLLSLKQVASAIPSAGMSVINRLLIVTLHHRRKLGNIICKSINGGILKNLPLYYHQQYPKRPNPAFLNSFTLSISAP